MDPLVSTRLRPSQSRPKLVSRPRLVQRLAPEAGRGLTLVSAPAGFGTTRNGPPRSRLSRLVDRYS